MTQRWRRNEIRLHSGPHAYFGQNGVENPVDPFDVVGFESDFAYMQTLNADAVLPLWQGYEGEGSIPKRIRRRWCVTLCPAHLN
jgi:hypothetical protein